jgi:hypothetical protein
MSKKMITMHLTLLFACLAVFGIGDFGLSVYGLCFLPRNLFNHCQGIRDTFSEILIKFYATPFVGSIAKSHQARYNTPNKGYKQSASPRSCVKICTLTPTICWYYHLPLHRAITIAEQMAAPVQEIMEAPRNISEE